MHLCLHQTWVLLVPLPQSLAQALLRRPGTRQQLAPKLPAPERVGVLFSRFPRFCSGGFIAWAVQVWQRRRERSDLQPDAQILVRFCELGLKFSLLGTVLSLVLLPMYATGPGQAGGFNVFCLSNLKVHGSIRFWCVILAAYLLTSAFGYLVLSEWRIFVQLRRSHFASAACGLRGPVAAQACRTVMVQEVPLNRWSEQDITAFFEKIYGTDSVYSCVCAGSSDSEEVHPDLHSFAHLIQVNTGSATAFVTLKSAEHCAVAQQVVLSHDPGRGLRPRLKGTEGKCCTNRTLDIPHSTWKSASATFPAKKGISLAMLLK